MIQDFLKQDVNTAFNLKASEQTDETFFIHKPILIKRLAYEKNGGLVVKFRSRQHGSAGAGRLILFGALGNCSWNF